MKRELPPEAADGGWWYVLEPIVDADGWTLGEVPGVGYCAWDGEVDGILYVTVRTPLPVVGLDTVDDVTPAQVLEAAHAAGDIPAPVKPYGRIGGA